MAKHHRRRGLRGITDLDMGSAGKNVALGAGINVAGSLLGGKIFPNGLPLVPAGGLPLIGNDTGLILGLLVAGLSAFLKKHRAAGMQIALGAGLVSAKSILTTAGLTMGLVTADRMGAVVPTVRMSDGSIRALTDGELGGPPVSVTQGMGRYGLAGQQAGFIH